MKRPFFLFALVALACKSDPEPTPSSPTVASNAASVTAKATAPSASSAPSPKQDSPIRTKAYGNPRADTLGTLPKGVGVPLGDKAPDATLKDRDGKDVHLSSLYGKGDILLMFYRGGWCPFCNFQVREIVKTQQQFTKRGITPVLVSVDQPTEARKTGKAHRVDFPILSDPDLALHKAFNVLSEVDDETYQKLKARGTDLEEYSGKKHHTIAVPAVFWIDSSGTVRFAHANLDYKVRPSALQIVRAIDEIKKGKQPPKGKR